MKRNEKARSVNNDLFDLDGQRKRKLKPRRKEKYRTKEFLLDEEEEELDLFNFENDQ